VGLRALVAGGKGPGFAGLDIDLLETERVPTVGHRVWLDQSGRRCSAETRATSGAMIA